MEIEAIANADDIAIILSEKSLTDGMVKLQLVVEGVNIHLARINLSINASKTVLIAFYYPLSHSLTSSALFFLKKTKENFS